MNPSRWLRIVLAVAVAAALFTPRITARASSDRDDRGGTVFVQTNNPAGNAIVVFHRHADGTLTRAATVATGGRGARAAGSSSDPLASQGALVFDARSSMLFAVNAGSDSVSVLRADGDALHLRQVVPSGGEFPVSIAVRGGSVVVLNAGGRANISGFRLDDSRLRPLSQDTRSLGLTETNPPQFLASPAQVGFTPDGEQVLVTGKTNNFVDVFAVRENGRLSARPATTHDAAVPFAFLFSPEDQLDLVNAAGNLAPSDVRDGGRVAPTGPVVPNGQTASCWIATAGRIGFVANTGSNDVSAYRLGDDGRVTLLDATAATGISGPTDEATAQGRFLYVLSGLTASVDVFAVSDSGALTLRQMVSVPGGADQEGIAAR
jgi:6-phosphogluconolactonase (cycloisomerase 2 family)